MKVVILCGGLGTRMREETEYRPKPMVEIGGKPVLWHVMKTFAHGGLREFVLCLGYKGQVIKDYFLNYEAMNNDFTIELGARQRLELHGAHAEQGFTVTLADTGLDAMTGARVKRVQRYVDGDELMVTYGDGLSDLDLGALLRFHRAHGKKATVTAVRPYSRFGILSLGADDRVERFAEKPQSDDEWASAGFFVFHKSVFEYLSDDASCVLEEEPLRRLAADGELRAYERSGYFFAMDTYREYKQLNDAWASGAAPWKVWK